MKSVFLILLSIATASADVSLSSAPHGQQNNIGSCAKNPPGTGPATLPDTPAAFVSNKVYANAAKSAKTPAGFTSSFTNLNAVVTDRQILTQTISRYDPQICADFCKSTHGCVSFNIYYVRNPTVVPGNWCQNPASLTNINCRYSTTNTMVRDATFTSGSLVKFQIVVAGSNAYNINPVGVSAKSSSSSSIKTSSSIKGSSSMPKSSSAVTSSSLKTTKSSSTTIKASSSTTVKASSLTTVKASSSSSVSTSTKASTPKVGFSLSVNVGLSSPTVKPTSSSLSSSGKVSSPSLASSSPASKSSAAPAPGINAECPGADGKDFTGSTNGRQYTVFCNTDFGTGWSYIGNNFESNQTGCLEYMDTQTNLEGVAVGYRNGFVQCFYSKRDSGSVHSTRYNADIGLIVLKGIVTPNAPSSSAVVSSSTAISSSSAAASVLTSSSAASSSLAAASVPTSSSTASSSSAATSSAAPAPAPINAECPGADGQTFTGSTLGRQYTVMCNTDTSTGWTYYNGDVNYLSNATDCLEDLDTQTKFEAVTVVFENGYVYCYYQSTDSGSVHTIRFNQGVQLIAVKGIINPPASSSASVSSSTAISSSSAAASVPISSSTASSSSAATSSAAPAPINAECPGADGQTFTGSTLGREYTVTCNTDTSTGWIYNGDVNYLSNATDCLEDLDTQTKFEAVTVVFENGYVDCYYQSTDSGSVHTTRVNPGVQLIAVKGVITSDASSSASVSSSTAISISSSALTPSSTVVSSSAAATSSAFPTDINAECPAADGQTFTGSTNGRQFTVACSNDYGAGWKYFGANYQVNQTDCLEYVDSQYNIQGVTIVQYNGYVACYYASRDTSQAQGVQPKGGVDLIYETTTRIAPCYAADDSVYTDASGHQYNLHCGTNTETGGVNQFEVSTTTFAQCLDICGSTPNCGGVTWVLPLNQCFGKTIGSISNITAETDCESAVLVPVDSPPSASSSAVSSSSSTAVPSSTISSSSSPATSSAAPLCPGSDGMNYTDAATDVYQIYCGHNYDSGQNIFGSTVNDMEACIEACSDWSRTSGNGPCTGMSFWPDGPSYGYGNCYGHDHPGSFDNYGGINSAVLVMNGSAPTS